MATVPQFEYQTPPVARREVPVIGEVPVSGSEEKTRRLGSSDFFGFGRRR